MYYLRNTLCDTTPLRPHVVDHCLVQKCIHLVMISNALCKATELKEIFEIVVSLPYDGFT